MAIPCTSGLPFGGFGGASPSTRCASSQPSMASLATAYTSSPASAKVWQPGAAGKSMRNRSPSGATLAQYSISPFSIKSVHCPTPSQVSNVPTVQVTQALSSGQFHTGLPFDVLERPNREIPCGVLDRNQACLSRMLEVPVRALRPYVPPSGGLESPNNFL